MPRLTREPGAILAEAFCMALEADGIGARTEARSSRCWASVTFAGARHRLTLRLTGDAAAIDAQIAALPERDLPMTGHFVADVAVLAREPQADGATLVTLEALTVEAA